MKPLPSCSRKRWFAAVALGVAWTMVAPTPASAQATGSGTSDRVSLDVEACPTVPTVAVRHILGIEIGDLLLEEGQSPTAARHRLTIRCAGTVAWVEAAGEGGADPLDRTLRLDSFPGDAAPRALALAGLELLAARSPAVRARMEAKREPPAAISPPGLSPPRSPWPREPRRLRYLGLGGTWRWFWAGPGLSTWGGQAQVGWLSDRWHFSADLEATGASRDVQLGGTSALVFSGGAAFGLAGAGNRAFTLALGARLGVARLAGSAADPTAVIASAVLRPWGGPMASLGFVGLLRPLAVVMKVEAGRSLFTAEAQSEGITVLAVGGTWVALSLGVAVMR